MHASPVRVVGDDVVARQRGDRRTREEGGRKKMMEVSLSPSHEGRTRHACLMAITRQRQQEIRGKEIASSLPPSLTLFLACIISKKLVSASDP